MEILYYKMSEEDFYNLSKVREYWESEENKYLRVLKKFISSPIGKQSVCEEYLSLFVKCDPYAFKIAKNHYKFKVLNPDLETYVTLEKGDILNKVQSGKVLGNSLNPYRVGQIYEYNNSALLNGNYILDGWVPDKGDDFLIVPWRLARRSTKKITIRCKNVNS